MDHPLFLSELNEFYGMIFRYFANAPKKIRMMIHEYYTTTNALIVYHILV